MELTLEVNLVTFLAKSESYGLIIVLGYYFGTYIFKRYINIFMLTKSILISLFLFTLYVLSSTENNIKIGLKR